MDSMPKDNFYVSIRTPAAKEGDCQVGVTYPVYLYLFGALINMGAAPLEHANFESFTDCDVLAVMDGDLVHSHHDAVRGVEGMVEVSVQSILDTLLPVVSGLPAQAISAYRMYQEMIDLLSKGHRDAGIAGKTLNRWKVASNKLHEAATEMIDRAQFKLDLEDE